MLIHGASGGVGQFATPLAARHGVHVTATASPPGVERARELGADVVIDHTAGPWEAGIDPVDLVFDTAGLSDFYPEVAVAFTVTDPGEHYHVPLLLSPYAYSTYRGS